MCVDLISLPSDRFTEIGLDVSNTSMTDVPGRTNFPAAPVSITSISAVILTLPVFKHAAALGRSCKVLSEIVCSQALA